MMEHGTKTNLLDTTLTEVDFLRTEIRTGLTFARIARESKRTSPKRSRNRTNGRKAYDTVLRFAPKVSLSDEEAEDINSKLKQLKTELKDLGEEV